MTPHIRIDKALKTSASSTFLLVRRIKGQNVHQMILTFASTAIRIGYRCILELRYVLICFCSVYAILLPSGRGSIEWYFPQMRMKYFWWSSLHQYVSNFYAFDFILKCHSGACEWHESSWHIDMDCAIKSVSSKFILSHSNSGHLILEQRYV